MGLKRVVLDNGVTVLHQQIEGIGDICVGIVVGIGARDEPLQLNGISHMFEHMLFLGSKRYPGELAFARAIESLSTDFNAETGDYHTLVNATVKKAGLKHILPILVDAITNPIFQNKSLRREKNNVVNEIREQIDKPKAFCDAEFFRIILAGTPDARPIRGTEETVRRLTTWDLRRFHKEHYHAGNIALVVTGDFAPRTLLSLAEKYLGHMPKTEPNIREFKRFARYQPRVSYIKRQQKQTYVTLGIPIKPLIPDEDRVKWQIFSDMVGDGMSGLLYEQVTAKRGLAYTLDAALGTDPDSSSFKLNFACKPEDVGRVLAVVKKVLVAALYDRRRFNETKKRHLASLDTERGNPDPVFENACSTWAETREMYSDRREKRLFTAVTLKEVRDEVEPYLDFDNWTTVMVGP